MPSSAMHHQLSAKLINNKAETIGSIMIRDMDMGVLLEIKATMLPPGKHGLHITRLPIAAT